MTKYVYILALVFVAASCAARQEKVTTNEPAPSKSEAKVAATPEPAKEKEDAMVTKAEEKKVEEKADKPLGNSPKDVIQRYTEQLRSLVEPDKREGKVTRNKEKEQKIAEKVREFFDFNRLAKSSLGRHWKGLSKSKRAEFSTLFIDLIEDSYLRRSRDLVGEYEMKYGAETIRNGYAKVISSVVRSDADVDIVYELHKPTTNWMIYNIILDDVDLIRNYQSQFNRIIQNNGFNELLRKMRKKKNETEKEATI